MMTLCHYCAVDGGKHALLCPMVSIERDPKRLAAFHLTRGDVATSDWVDSLALVIDRGLQSAQREKATAAFGLYHRWVERVTTARFETELAQLRKSLEVAERTVITIPEIQAMAQQLITPAPVIAPVTPKKKAMRAKKKRRPS